MEYIRGSPYNFWPEEEMENADFLRTEKSINYTTEYNESSNS
jgi:hypothetical protein